MIISIDAEKAFYTIQHSFNIKNDYQMSIEGTYLNMIKAMPYMTSTQPTSYSAVKIGKLSH